MLAGQPHRLADLAEYLAFPDDHGVESAGHGEQMLGGAVLVVHVGRPAELGRRDARVTRQQVADHRDPAMEAVYLGIDLDPVARAQHQRSGDAG